MYLDMQSCTPVKPEVLDVIVGVLKNHYANPSSIYGSGTISKSIIDNARTILANRINSSVEEIIFTSSASEANTAAIKGYLDLQKDPLLITSMIEHDSIRMLSNNYDTVYISVDKNGEINYRELEVVLDRYRNRNILVSIMGANNEIGTIQDIKRIAKISHKYGAKYHCDASALFGHREIDVKNKEIDLMTFAGQKIGCPIGIACLYKNKDITLKPLVYGHQELGVIGGTENIAYIAGFGKAVELLLKDTDKLLIEKQEYFINELLKINGITLNGSRINRLANNINIRISGKKNDNLLVLLDLLGIEISKGSACNSGTPTPSHVLKAIGLSDEEALSSIRISYDEQLTIKDIDEFIKILKEVIRLSK